MAWTGQSSVPTTWTKQSSSPAALAGQRTKTVTGRAVCSNTKEQDTLPVLPLHDLTDHLPEHAGTTSGVLLLLRIEIVYVLLSGFLFHVLSRLRRFITPIIGTWDNFYASAAFFLFLVNADRFANISGPSLLEDIAQILQLERI